MNSLEHFLRAFLYSAWQNLFERSAACPHISEQLAPSGVLSGNLPPILDIIAFPIFFAIVPAAPPINPQATLQPNCPSPLGFQ